MSFVTAADVLSKNIAYGNFGYRVINGEYEPGDTFQFYSDMTSASTGVMGLVTDHASIKVGAFGSASFGLFNKASYLLSPDAANDPYLAEKKSEFVADAASWLISGYEVLSKVPAPQARAIGILLGAVGTALDWYISTGEVEIANEQELARLRALEEKHAETIERLEVLKEGLIKA